MTEEQEKQIEQLISKKFSEVKTAGIKTGALMVCGVVLSIANKDKPYNQRINEIIEFCKTTCGKSTKGNENN